MTFVHGFENRLSYELLHVSDVKWMRASCGQLQKLSKYKNEIDSLTYGRKCQDSIGPLENEGEAIQLSRNGTT